MKKGQYWSQLGALKGRLQDAVPREELRRLHERVWWRHYAIFGRQILLVAVAVVAALAAASAWIWVPLSVFLGFAAFNFTVLLHEVVHSTLFAHRHPRLEALMGYVYALPSGISKTQFTRWHLDHHNELGSDEDDPKRRWLTPRVVKRWYKLLYCTVALFPIYFRAAAREARSYPPDVQKAIRSERGVTVALHVAAMLLLARFGGGDALVRLYVVPYFVVFPIAFTLNRLGQHYNIDPTNPLKWGTLMRASRLWDFLFLHSNYHLEHHYFPNVPFYNLRRLHFLLADFYRREGLVAHTYRDILWGWFIQNHVPHTDWSAAPARGQVEDAGRVAATR